MISYPPYTNFSRGRCLTFIDTEGLILNKNATGRTKDLADAEALKSLKNFEKQD